MKTSMYHLSVVLLLCGSLSNAVAQDAAVEERLKRILERAP